MTDFVRGNPELLTDAVMDLDFDGLGESIHQVADNQPVGHECVGGEDPQAPTLRSY